VPEARYATRHPRSTVTGAVLAMAALGEGTLCQ